MQTAKALSPGRSQADCSRPPALPQTLGSEHPSPIRLYADGLCQPQNPGGWACWGWLAVDAEACPGAFKSDGRRLAEGRGCLGHGRGMTDNVAEYHAAIEALKWAAGQGLQGMVLHSDSQLLVNQANGSWQCRTPHLFDLLARLRSLMAETGARLSWVPREQNEEADRLSRQAYQEARRSGGDRLESGWPGTVGRIVP